MTRPERFTRNATEVEAMPLDGPADLHLVELWLRGHGLRVSLTHPTLISRGLMVVGPTGFVARLGQWVVHDITAGTWGAVDDRLFRTGLYAPLLADVRALAARR